MCACSGRISYQSHRAMLLGTRTNSTLRTDGRTKHTLDESVKEACLPFPDLRILCIVPSLAADVGIIVR